jgi:hypothetical protein
MMEKVRSMAIFWSLRSSFMRVSGLAAGLIATAPVGSKRSTGMTGGLRHGSASLPLIWPDPRRVDAWIV